MKYCYVIILLCIIFLENNLSAQDFSYTLSNEIFMRNSDEYQGLVRADSTGYTLHIYERNGKGLLGFPGRNLILEKYDKQFNQVFSYAYGEDEKEPLITVELIAVGEYYIWIVMEQTSKFKYEYSMIPIDLAGKLGKKEFLFSNTVEKYGDLPQTYTRLSPDSTKVVFIASFDDNRKKEATEIFATVINENATIEWDKFTKLRGNQKQHTIKDYKINNEGDVFFVSKSYKDSKAKEKIKNRRNKLVAGYDIVINKIQGAKDQKLNKTKLELKGAFVSDVKLLLNSQGDLFCAGLMTSQSKDNINGVFYANLNEELVIKNFNKRPFTTKELIKLSREDAEVNLKNKERQGLDNDFEMTDMFYTKDSTIYIIAEQNYYRAFVSYDNSFNNGFGPNTGIRGNNNTTTFYSNDILILSIDSEKEFRDLELVSKKQSATIYDGISYYRISEERKRELDYFLSHSYMIDDTSPIFFYNENEDNLESDNTKYKEVRNPRKMKSVIASKYEDEYYLDLALPGFDNNLLLSPTRSKQIGENDFFFTSMQSSSSKGSTIRIGVIKFN